jgi:hypothetical protein
MRTARRTGGLRSPHETSRFIALQSHDGKV